MYYETFGFLFNKILFGNGQQADMKLSINWSRKNLTVEWPLFINLVEYYLLCIGHHRTELK